MAKPPRAPVVWSVVRAPAVVETRVIAILSVPRVRRWNGRLNETIANKKQRRVCCWRSWSGHPRGPPFWWPRSG
jgi:hypothetical protein